ncbi:competence/damage-inducible protein A [Cytophaga aurantiaca]|uniref:competence/damage-inducible protein A n=1 Tax=Cytophaga aurantiaca TaxID=29530 RepID=UPI00036D0C46|nr:competence/damage-inducible protein A [Cytophaga aurantiaca]
MSTQIYADIITIGDEILYGQITDTNSQWISAELDKLGIKTRQKSSVSDKADEILRILDESSKRASLVIITGGLGPTNDDITKKTLCTFFNTELVWNDEVLKHLQNLFFVRGRELSELNKQQALVPANCEILTNSNGTAPGMWMDVNNVVYISLPGVPYEMKGILSEFGFTKIKNRFQTPVIVHRMIKTIGIGESTLSEIIKEWENALPKHIGLAYLPSAGEVKLRLTGVGENEAQIKTEIQQQINDVLPLIHTHVYGYDEDTLQKSVGDLLKSKNKTIATAESCTGGYLAHLLTSVPGASAYYYGSIIAYQNIIKTQLLDVPSGILQQHGAVSEKTVEIMAKEVRLKLGTSIGVAASGIAGPDGGTAEKPVGTIWIAYADEDKVVTKKLQLSALRENNIRMTALAILNLIRQQLTT